MSSYLVLLWVHLLAAMSWIGGMLFLSLVLAPLVRNRKSTPEFIALFRLSALRFRFMVWLAIALLLGTGPLLVLHRGWPLLNPSGWPLSLRIKLSLVAVLLLLTLVHDLLVGPQIRQISALQEGQRTSWQQSLLRSSAWLPRVALLIGLAVVASAVLVSRS